MKKKVMKIGIDFGTNYSFACFVHGEAVCSLIPSNETYGIPSVFYDDGKMKLIGRMAERRAVQHPECAVRSVKRRLKESCVLRQGLTVYTPQMVVEEIMAYVVQLAEQQLANVYMEEYDEVEAVIAVPVDFSEPMLHLIREAARKVKLGNGARLVVTALITEPVAASIEYFGVKKERDAKIMVFDLGGGTFDAAIVEASCKDKTPYRVLDQAGIGDLGGDKWDQVLADLLTQRYESITGKKRKKGGEAVFLAEARRIKEELTDLTETTATVMVEGNYVDIPVTRTEFEQASAGLMQQALDKVGELVNRNPEIKIDHVVLTGGSSYMPQVRSALAGSSIFGKETDILMMKPEHAIASGCARYAATLKRPDFGSIDGIVIEEEPMVELISSHGYGVGYVYPKQNNARLIDVFIPKGSPLPIRVSMVSSTLTENQKVSHFSVYEVDCMEKGKLLPVTEGREVMAVNLKRKAKKIPKGSKSTETLTLSKDGLLSIATVDHNSGIKAENSITLERKL